MPRRVEEGVCEVDCVNPQHVVAARAALPPMKVHQRAAEAFKVLAHPNRLRVLVALNGRELCVCDIAQVLGLSMSATSQMLRELRNLGAVEYRAEGKLAYYTLADRFWCELAEAVVERCGAETRP